MKMDGGGEPEVTSAATCCKQLALIARSLEGKDACDEALERDQDEKAEPILSFPLCHHTTCYTTRSALLQMTTTYAERARLGGSSLYDAILALLPFLISNSRQLSPPRARHYQTLIGIYFKPPDTTAPLSKLYLTRGSPGHRLSLPQHL